MTGERKRRELLRICALETDKMAASKSGEERAYFCESGAVLKGILAEMGSG